MKTKTCSGCKFCKTLDDYFSSKTQSDGYQSYCKDCNRISAREWYRQSSKPVQKIKARIRLLKKYGLTLDEYNLMFEEQGGVCAICNLAETQISNKKGGVDSLKVDHCHKTNLVRGLLCSKCNFGIGLLQDKIGNALSATRYLLKSYHKLDKTKNK